MTVLVFLILFNFNLDKVESVFYDYGIRVTKENNKLLNNFFLISIDKKSSDYFGDIYPYSNKIIHDSLKNIIKSKPKAVIILPELSTYNYQDRLDLNKISKTLKKYQASGGIVLLKQKIDSWGESTLPESLKAFEYLPSVLHQDSNVFGEDGITRRAVITISGNQALETRISEIINPSFKLSKLPGVYYSEQADAKFSLIKFSKSSLNGLVESLDFYKTISNGPALANLRGKVVIVGTSFKSNAGDFRTLPGGVQVSQAQLIAEISSSLALGNSIMMISKKVSYILALLITIIMVVSVFYMKPSNGIFVFISTIITLIVFCYLTLYFTGYYFRVSESLLIGVVAFYFCTPFRSVLENKRNFALKEEARILKEVDELKRNFVSLMSHDLKTPVAKISSVVDILKLENSDRKIVLELEKIEDSTIQLNDFINSILDLTKMESDKLKLNLKTVDLNKLVEKVYANLAEQASRHNIQLKLNLDILFPITIDEKLGLRVINNLMENAIKYSGEGSTVEVETKDEGDKVKLVVRDNGVGIPEKEIKYIFEKFYRVRNDEIPGNGLGLFLVKYFVELMGGSILVSSSLNEGTEFSVFLKNT